jgi:formylglycine-generating enzyme required for sulfatase activity
MGCSPGDTQCFNSEKPAHQVTLTKGFWIGQTEVTQEAYQRVIAGNPSPKRGARLPVERVSWNEAQAYCRAIGMRLPAEAEWEYAARAGDRSARYGWIDSLAWYNTDPHEVGQKSANRFGLFDMLGNVWEWVSDWYGAYISDATSDPRGPASGQLRVMRGGGSTSAPSEVRPSTRLPFAPDDGAYNVGFRCAGD